MNGESMEREWKRRCGMGRRDQTALMLATCTGHGEIARLLLRAGANLSLRGRGAPGFAERRPVTWPWREA